MTGVSVSGKGEVELDAAATLIFVVWSECSSPSQSVKIFCVFVFVLLNEC